MDQVLYIRSAEDVLENLRDDAYSNMDYTWIDVELTFVYGIDDREDYSCVFHVHPNQPVYKIIDFIRCEIISYLELSSEPIFIIDPINPRCPSTKISYKCGEYTFPCSEILSHAYNKIYVYFLKQKNKR